MNKKGAEITVGTIIIIILALVVLVVLIYGFSTGWGNLWENLIGIGGGKENVATVVQSCQVACSTGSKYDYCGRNRNVVFDAKNKNDPRNRAYTCISLFREQPEAGLEACSSIVCDSDGKACVAGWGGTWDSVCEVDFTDVPQEYISLSDRESNPMKDCCVAQKTCEVNGWGGNWVGKCTSNQYDITRLVLIEERSEKMAEGLKCCLAR